MVPEISVVIGTHNRSRLLARCIGALEEQTQDPSTFELVVADDGSSDDTVELVSALQTPFALRVLDLGKVGRAHARNAGVEAAEAPLVLVIDDDVIAAPELIAAHLEGHREHGDIVGIGRLLQAAPQRHDWYARAFAETWNARFDGLRERDIDWPDCFAGNLSASRGRLLEVGGFRQLETGEDADLGFRLAAAGSRIRYLPEASAVHDDQKPRARLVAHSRLQGAGQVALADRVPAMRAKLLGWFGMTTRREVALRRALLALRVPPGFLASAGRLLPGAGRRLLWFQFVSRFAYWHGVRSAVSRQHWLQLTRGVPVLMYHAFSERDVGDRYVVSRRALSRQMRLLRLMRFRPICLAELVETLREGRLPPPRAVVVTIDDGYSDNLEIAAPLLRRHGFPATIFLVSERLGGVGDWSRGEQLRDRPILSPTEIEQLREHGIDFGAHTRTHPHLPMLGDDEVEAEVAGSRQDLEVSLGGEVTHFAYPYGELDDRAVEAVREADFAAAFTTDPRLVGLDEDLFRIPRIEVRSGDSLLRLAAHLWFGGA